MNIPFFRSKVRTSCSPAGSKASVAYARRHERRSPAQLRNIYREQARLPSPQRRATVEYLTEADGHGASRRGDDLGRLLRRMSWRMRPEGE
jgi:hypothetical protein